METINEALKQAIYHGQQVRVTTYSEASIMHNDEFDRYMKLARSSGATEKELLMAAHICFPGSYSKEYIDTQDTYLSAQEIIKIEKQSKPK